jgi:hypothetical protein
VKLALPLSCVAVAIAAAASGCTWQQGYASGQAWQRNACNRLPEQIERDRCLGQTNTSYEDYKRQTGDPKK